ncbi:MAG: PIN domain-containing protein [Acidobacteriaceae bacterium]|jgi:predicted nucleic acid-binding protein
MSEPHIYCDANPIIELAKYSRRTSDPIWEPDCQMMQRILHAANNKEISLFTSSISIAECVSAGDDWGQEVQEFLVNLLSSGRMFKLVQDSIFIAEQARDLRWKHNIRLQGMDAIHVASAIDANCTEFLTCDTDMSKPKVADKIRVLASVGISVITPSQTKLLTALYLSADPNLLNFTN